MSVVLNEVGIQALFRGPQMAKVMETRAEAVRVQAFHNANNDIIGILTGNLIENIFARVEEGPEGVQAVVGTTARNDRGEAYPNWWDKVGGKPWLFSALAQFFPDARRT